MDDSRLVRGSHKGNRRPDYEVETPGGYRDEGQGERYHAPVYTSRGLAEQKFFEKTSKHDIYQVALHLALRLSEDDFDAALAMLESEKSILKANEIT